MTNSIQFFSDECFEDTDVPHNQSSFEMMFTFDDLRFAKEILDRKMLSHENEEISSLNVVKYLLSQNANLEVKHRCTGALIFLYKIIVRGSMV